ncbi:hypothetical protein IFM89_007318, partial [Coptis chinensis]
SSEPVNRSFYNGSSALFSSLLILLLVNSGLSLELHFYKSSCPQAELVVKTIMKQEFKRDSSIAAGLLRLHFHDCFVRVRFKSSLSWFFKCAHSVGFCHCGFFANRLYNFIGTGRADPTLDPGVLGFLMKKCPRPVTQIFNISKDPTVFMTPTSKTPFKLDSSFYQGVLNGEAVLQLDQGLAFTDVTQKLAAEYIQQPNVFRCKFARAIIKLGNVGVLQGQQGEIRLNCRRVN